MERFEYQIIQFKEQEMVKGIAQNKLNDLGSNGWEVISQSNNGRGIATTYFTLKRQV